MEIQVSNREKFNSNKNNQKNSKSRFKKWIEENEWLGH